MLTIAAVTMATSIMVGTTLNTNALRRKLIPLKQTTTTLLNFYLTSTSVILAPFHLAWISVTIFISVVTEIETIIR